MKISGCCTMSFGCLFVLFMFMRTLLASYAVMLVHEYVTTNLLCHEIMLELPMSRVFNIWLSWTQESMVQNTITTHLSVSSVTYLLLTTCDHPWHTQEFSSGKSQSNITNAVRHDDG